MDIEETVKKELEAIPQIIDAGIELSISEIAYVYSDPKTGLDYFGNIWKDYLENRAGKGFPKKRSFCRPITSLFDAGGEGMKYEEGLVFIDIAYDVAASIDSVLRWKESQKSGSPDREIRRIISPDSILAKTGVCSEKDCRILRGEMKPAYIQPISLDKIPKMKCSEFAEETASRYAETHDIYSEIFFSTAALL